MRLGAETMAQLDKEWPALIERVRQGDLIKHIVADAGLKREHVYAYMRERPADVRQQWDEARQDSADALYERAVEEGLREDVDKDSAQHVRTRIDTLKWAARIRNPRLYGDKATLDVNVTKTVNLNAIIAAADARLAHARDVIEGEIIRPALPAELASIL